VHIFNPFDGLNLEPKFMEKHSFLKTDSCRFAIALGLAMRK
jgi:hypothetical protein